MSLFLKRLLVVLGMAACLNLSAAGRYISERDQQVVTKTIADCDAAVLRADAEALGKLLSDNYTFIDANGTVLGKADVVNSYRTGDLKIETLSRGQNKLDLYVGAGLVTGTMSIKGKYKKDDISGEYRFTEIYEPRTGGIWQLTYVQLTKVAEKK